MADVNYITDKNGNKVNIADLTARTNASTALLESEYNRQLADNVYAGRDISTITALASEIASAGSTPAFLNARAKAGNFNGLRIGDWTDIVLSSGVTMRYQIAAFDHYYNCADAAMGHHIVMVPTSTPAVTGDYAINGSYIYWNTTNTNNGTADESNPYLASNLHAWETGVFLPLMPTAWQNVMRNHRSLVETRYSASGALTDSTSWKWADLGKIWSPSEMEVYGCPIWGTKGYGQGMDSQFPKFRETKNRIKGRIAPCREVLRLTRAASTTMAVPTATPRRPRGFAPCPASSLERKSHLPYTYLRPPCAGAITREAGRFLEGCF